MKSFWEERYADEDYVYGELPNAYLQLKLKGLKLGKILFPADGEGRNSVYASGLGWQVFAYDFSEKAKEKAFKLANRKGVEINYTVGNIKEVQFEKESFDAIGLIYSHVPTDLRAALFQQVHYCLKPGGRLIFEAFSKNHNLYQQVNPNAGGPRDINMLYSVEELQAGFEGYTWKDLKEEVVDLNEGPFHQGRSAVVRAFGVKMP
ncbi:MAG: class I SAM-dependent methyltransferase [Bacteroidetes bacterium]|nr:class I SAM-dependent methyltransferase [Bacteroidota bacterium]